MFMIAGSPRRTSRDAVTHTATAPVTDSHAPVVLSYHFTPATGGGKYCFTAVCLSDCLLTGQLKKS